MKFTLNIEQALADSLDDIKRNRRKYIASREIILSNFKYNQPKQIADEVSNVIRNNVTSSYNDIDFQNILSCMMDDNDDSKLIEYLSTNTKDLNIPELVDSINSILNEIKAGYRTLLYTV